MRSWSATWDAFRLATRDGWRRFPEWLEGGFLWSRPGERGVDRRQALRWLLRFALRSRRHRLPAARPGACLVVCHSESGSVLGPLSSLARDLAAGGTRALLWDTSTLSEITVDNRIPLLDVADTWSWLNEASALPQAWRALLKGGIAAFVLRRRLPRTVSARKSFLVLWRECTLSRHRMDRAADLLSSAGIDVVLATHERFPPCGAFVLAARELGIRTVLYQHGLPGGYDEPVLSDEVLVWNETAASFFASAERLPGEPAPRIRISGNLELESADVAVHERKRSASPVVLVLSQCDDQDEWRNGESARETLRWIAAATRALPTIRFLIKERTYGDLLRTWITAENLDKHEQVEIVDGRESFTDVLRDREVAAVCAFSSSGLYVAAGLGVRTLRLVTDSAIKGIPLLDEVTEQARTEGEFLTWLARLHDEPLAFQPRIRRLTALEIVRFSLVSEANTIS